MKEINTIQINTFKIIQMNINEIIFKKRIKIKQICGREVDEKLFMGCQQNKMSSTISCFLHGMNSMNRYR